jgi:hypothetical protein
LTVGFPVALLLSMVLVMQRRHERSRSPAHWRLLHGTTPSGFGSKSRLPASADPRPIGLLGPTDAHHPEHRPALARLVVA